MSASPSGPPGASPNGTPIRRRRPKPAANPLVVNRRPQKPKQPLPKPQPTSAPLASAQARPSAPALSNTPVVDRPTTFAERPQSPTPEGNPTIFPVYTTKRALLEGFRHHVARLHSKNGVDVSDEAAFVRPVRLHRRDPGAKPPGSTPSGDIEMKDAEDDKERERIEAAKAERQRQREENAKLIAPSAPSKPKRPAFKKKTEQVWPTHDDPEARKRQQLKYEESLPWHLEDFDNKQTWVSMYEAALSGCHVMLMMEDNHFRLIPLEKWYRFRDMSKVKRTDPEQVEKMMSKKIAVPTWFLKKQKEAEIKQLQEKDSQRARGLFQRAGDKEEDKKLRGQDLADRPEAPPPDADDIDFDHDELFQDDEENELFEGDADDQKDATEKIKREQRNANVFDLNDENEVDEEEETELKLHEISKQLEKGTRKALLKREKNYDYEDDDSDKDPYASESESEDSDDELLKEEERKREEERKASEKGKGRDKDDDRSGASTRGNNTPSGRKKPDLLKVKVSTANLKRPGSPIVSDASGNESSRKKAKKNHKLKEDKTRRSSLTNMSLRQGSGSESEGGKRTTLKLRMSGSPDGTPRGSRAGSPAGGMKRLASVGAGSRPGSPPASTPGASGKAQISTDAPLPSTEDILATIPPEGMHITELTKIFRSRVSQSKTMDFIRLVRRITDYDAAKKTVRRKTQAPTV